jgi:hypothetical protein
MDISRPGAVDYAGTAGLASNAKVIHSYTTKQLASGSVTLPVGTSTDSYVRMQVLNSAKVPIGLSNPIWLLGNLLPAASPSPGRPKATPPATIGRSING